MPERLTADDFFSGLFAALQLRNLNTLSMRNDRFDKAVEAVFEKLRCLAKERNVDLLFRIRLHPIHGDSGTIRDSITTAAQRDLVSLDNPEFQDIRIKLTDTESEKILERIPGGKELFVSLSQEFIAISDCHQFQTNIA